MYSGEAGTYSYGDADFNAALSYYGIGAQYNNNSGENRSDDNKGILSNNVTSSDSKDNIGDPGKKMGSSPAKPKPRNWDANGDGRLTLNEANRWYRIGRGKTIVVPASSININNIDVSTMAKMEIGNKYTVQLLYNNLFSDGAVYGQVDLIYLGSGQVQIVSNMYDFDIGADVGHP